jgi:hypothetical protein
MKLTMRISPWHLGPASGYVDHRRHLHRRTILIGLIFRNPNPSPSLDALGPGLQSGPQLHQPVVVSRERTCDLVEEFI